MARARAWVGLLLTRVFEAGETNIVEFNAELSEFFVALIQVKCTGRLGVAWSAQSHAPLLVLIEDGEKGEGKKPQTMSYTKALRGSARAVDAFLASISSSISDSCLKSLSMNQFPSTPSTST